MDQLIVRGVALSAKPTENHHQTLQLSSALQSVLTSFSSLFCFTADNFIILVIISPSANIGSNLMFVQYFGLWLQN